MNRAMPRELRFFDRYGDIRQTKNRLPHWQQDGATYFVTFHLADSVPSDLLADWRHQREAWMTQNPPPLTPKLEREYHTRFSGAIEHWLDAAHGSRLLCKREH